jgi:hypothetical protein
MAGLDRLLGVSGRGYARQDPNPRPLTPEPSRALHAQILTKTSYRKTAEPHGSAACQGADITDRQGRCPQNSLAVPRRGIPALYQECTPCARGLSLASLSRGVRIRTFYGTIRKMLQRASVGVRENCISRIAD